MDFGEKLKPDYSSPEKPKGDVRPDENFLLDDVGFREQEAEIIKSQDAGALEKVRDSLELKYEAIKKLEDANLVMSTESRVIMLLCAEGLKPVSTVWVGIKYIEDVKNIAKDLGLNFSVFNKTASVCNTLTGKNYKAVAFVLAKEKEMIDNYFKGFNKLEVNSGAILDDDQKREINNQAGNQYGYPKTAVDAFVNKEARMNIKDYPEEIQNSELGELLSKLPLFVKSKAHWPEEVAVYASWMDKVKELSPKIYHMILEMRSVVPDRNEPKKVQSFGDKIKNMFSKKV